MTDARCEPPPELRGKDGWHNIVRDGEAPTPALWEHEDGWWTNLRHDYRADKMAALGYRYHSPVLTPAEVASLRAERDAAVVEKIASAAISEIAIGSLRAEVERLKRLLEECANDLAMEIDSRYPNAGQHPSEAKRRDRDMEIVNLARAELESKP